MIRACFASLAALGIGAAANAQPCQPGPRLYDTDRAAYEVQARRVFAAHGVPYQHRRLFELDHRVPRCLAVGDYDGDTNLSPQPLAEALMKDQLEREVCWRVCHAETMKLDDAVGLFVDWQAGYRLVFGHPPGRGNGTMSDHHRELAAGAAAAP